MEPKYSLGLAGRAYELLEPIYEDDRTSFSRAGKGFQNGLEVPSHVPTFEKDGLRVEAQRTNFIENSDEISLWGLINVTSPEDNTIYDNTNSGVHCAIQANGAWNPNPYLTFSVELEKGTNRYVRIFENGGTSAWIWIDLETNEILSNSTTTGTVGFGKRLESSGLYRYWIAIDTTYISTSVNFQVRMSKDGISDSYIGDGDGSIKLYRGQIEDGTFPTSYIPTDSSTFTRVEEGFSTADLTLSNALTATTGSVYFDFYNVPNAELGSTKLRLKNDTAGIGVYFFNSAQDSLIAQTRDRDTTDNVQVWSPEGNRHRFLVTWDDSSSNLYYYGREVFSGGGMDTANVISFSSRGRTIIYDLQTYNTKVDIEEARKLFHLDSYTELVDQIKYKRL
jgi:hypothetical protein